MKVTWLFSQLIGVKSEFGSALPSRGLTGAVRLDLSELKSFGPHPEH